jgi:hypothetical protein
MGLRSHVSGAIAEIDSDEIIDRIANSYRTKKNRTKTEDNTLIKKEIANFDLSNVGETSSFFDINLSCVSLSNFF